MDDVVLYLEFIRATSLRIIGLTSSKFATGKACSLLREVTTALIR